MASICAYVWWSGCIGGKAGWASQGVHTACPCNVPAAGSLHAHALPYARCHHACACPDAREYAVASARSNCSRDRGLRAALEAGGAVIVLFVLSWRLAPAVSVVILVSALAAARYRAYTRAIEAKQSRALQQMAGVAHQAFDNMRTVRSFAGEALERERFQQQVGVVAGSSRLGWGGGSGVCNGCTAAGGSSS